MGSSPTSGRFNRRVMRKSWALIFFIALFLLVLLTLLLTLWQQRGFKAVPSNAYLQINLSGPIPEYSYGFGFAYAEQPVTVNKIYRVLKRAEKDSRIKKVLFFFRYAGTGWASGQEIRQMIKRLRKAGKETVALIEMGSDLDYYIASACDKVYLLPSAYLELNGIAVVRLYYKNMFEKLGVKAQIFHIGKYKTAAYPYKSDRMTQYEREEIEKVGKQIMDELVGGIAEARGLSRQEVLDLMNSKGAFVGVELEGSKLVDGVVSRQELEEKEFKGLKKEDFQHYLRAAVPNPEEGNIAVVYAVGTITAGSNRSDPFSGQIIGSDEMERIFEKLAKDSSIKAVVVRVDSPGGSAISSEVINRALRKLGSKKPVVVSMANYAASGGYYISVPAKKIFAQPLTITGSIGVLGGKISIDGLLSKLGINAGYVKFTDTALLNSPLSAYSDKEWEVLKKEITSFYKLFLKRVAEARGKSPEEIDRIARGKIWTGKDGERLGLVDGMGGLDRAIEEAKKLAGIRRARLVFYPKKPGFWEFITRFLTKEDPLFTFKELKLPLSLKMLLLMRRGGIYFLPLLPLEFN